MNNKVNKILGIACIILTPIGIITGCLGKADIIKPMWLSLLPLFIVMGIALIMLIICIIDLTHCFNELEQLDNILKKELEDESLMNNLIGKYVRTEDGRLTEVKENMEIKVSCDFGYFNKDLLYKDTNTLVLPGGKPEIVAQADNIFDLIQTGDLIRLSYDFTLTKVDTKTIDGIANGTISCDDILEIFTKQEIKDVRTGYVLVWDKKKGFINENLQSNYNI